MAGHATLLATLDRLAAEHAEMTNAYKTFISQFPGRFTEALQEENDSLRQELAAVYERCVSNMPLRQMPNGEETVVCSSSEETDTFADECEATLRDPLRLLAQPPPALSSEVNIREPVRMMADAPPALSPPDLNCFELLRSMADPPPVLSLGDADLPGSLSDPLEPVASTDSRRRPIKGWTCSGSLAGSLDSRELLSPTDVKGKRRLSKADRSFLNLCADRDLVAAIKRRDNLRAAEEKRIRHMLHLPTKQKTVHTTDLVEVLRKRCDGNDITLVKVEDMVTRMKNAHFVLRHYGILRDVPPVEDRSPGTIDFDVLLDLLLVSDAETVREYHDALGSAIDLINALKVVTVDEIVMTAVRGTAHDDGDKRMKHSGTVTSTPTDPELWEKRLNYTITVVVFVNIASMGISVDREPDHLGWLLLETFCSAMFVTEAVLRIRQQGCKEYFCGVACHWNITDFVITSISVIDVLFSMVIAIMRDSSLIVGNVTNAVRVAVVGRVLRIVRLVRLVKLVRSPFLRDLANMLVGFVIGMPALFWVLFFLCVLVYVFGLVMRILFGPLTDLLDTPFCRPADEMDVLVEEGLDGRQCRAHFLYGEEFFGNVTVSMFTAFRFMLGDYSTRNGKSIVVAFSQGYGARFDFVFVCWMIVVIFGFFNIITAIFVESTNAGLKHNDAKRKFALQYERQYVMRKLRHLIWRIKGLREGSRKSKFNKRYTPPPGSAASMDDISKIVMSEDEFMELMEDHRIRDLLEELDVGFFTVSGLFDTLDPEGTGEVALSSMVHSLMKLRGEPMKNDIIASWVSLRALHEKFDRLQFDVGKVATEYNRRCIKAAADAGGSPSAKAN
mmetsp:Transcript_101298/g.291813  ORF Transcript_101298/g.291813 Transcript_101298/m.291813 type:complete len:842 (+) Transcript_101298:108-2633(+)